MKKRVLMPPEGDWFPIGNHVDHTCCDCGAKHKWEFAYRGWVTGKVIPVMEMSDNILVKITRIDKPRRKK